MRRPSMRTLGTLVFLVALSVAIWSQRTLVGDAVDELGSLSLLALGVLLVLAVYERWSRADIVRRLLPSPLSWRAAFTVHDVGNAASKGLPMGGAVGTALRWAICRDASIAPRKLASMLVTYGIATTTATWALALVATSFDMIGRPAEFFDVALVIIATAVISVSWTVLLVTSRNDDMANKMAAVASWVWTRTAGRFERCRGQDPTACAPELRRDVRDFVCRPWGILGRTLGSQVCGAVILLVALRALGVGGELGVAEFLRVFFITHLFGSFAPTPGGVGVVEAGLTGALIAAGVDGPLALAGVIIYRLATYIAPIVVGAGLYAVWRARPFSSPSAPAVESAGSVVPVDGAVAPVMHGAPLPPPSPAIRPVA
ncbi:MAG: lysylphosphatidylglycerol synthase transmembrane domain-containing protein [Actinomycetota bacterium]